MTSSKKRSTITIDYLKEIEGSVSTMAVSNGEPEAKRSKIDNDNDNGTENGEEHKQEVRNGKFTENFLQKKNSENSENWVVNRNLWNLKFSEKNVSIKKILSKTFFDIKKVIIPKIRISEKMHASQILKMFKKLNFLNKIWKFKKKNFRLE